MGPVVGGGMTNGAVWMSPSTKVMGACRYQDGRAARESMKKSHRRSLFLNQQGLGGVNV